MNTMFEKAARLKLRFFYKGLITAEDLWDLNVTILNSIYQGLSAEAKALEKDSLMETKSSGLELNELQREIVKYIFNVKVQEGKEREDAAVQAQKRERILDIINQKRNAALTDMSIEDLEKLL